MKKSERLNNIMIYLMDKDSFNLSDLISTFRISRSTALRDITSLEDLGLPIYSEPGRYGGYKILKTRHIPPISFTNDEVFALYFSMLTLESYESTPFHLCFPSLKKKFTESISKVNAKKLEEMENVLELESSKHYNESPYLKTLVYSAVDKEVLKITYSKKGKLERKYIQIMTILAKEGNWYCTAFDFVKKAMRVYRCDRIKDIESCSDYEPIDFSKIQNPFYEFREKDKKYNDFKIEIDDEGVDIFRKENYPSMTLEREDGKFTIKGYYREGEEEEFLTKYLMNFGKSIKKIHPYHLHEALINRSRQLTKYYLHISDADILR